MKTVTIGIFAAGLSLLGLDAVAAPPAKVQITAAKKRGETAKPKTGGEGSQAKKTENVAYDLTLKDMAFGDLANLTVDYILFVERPKLGEKKNQPSYVERVTGSKQVATLTRQAPQVVSTDEVALKSENLVGNYIYSDGGRIKAEDSIVGVWVRVTEAGQIIGEYANPATVTKQGWDKK